MEYNLKNKRNEAEFKRELTGRVTKIIKFTLKIIFSKSSFLFEEARTIIVCYYKSIALV